MTVIPLRPRDPSRGQDHEDTGSARSTERTGNCPAAGLSDPPSEPDARVPGPATPLLGTFLSPSGRPGRMTGSMRLEHVTATTADCLWVEGVFTGELVDADGSRIGTTSRRHAAPARIARDLQGAPTVVGPLQVDLLGLTVTVQPFVVEATGPC